MALHQLVPLNLSRDMKPGRYPDGGGLYLQVYKNGSRAWCFRYMLDGKAREMGLGSLNSVSLAEARKRASECRRLKSEGTDPIGARRSKRQQAKLEAARALTFRECAEAYIGSHKAGWKSSKHAKQWTSTLETYAYPIIGDLPVQTLDTALVMKVLEPLFVSRPSTAKRLQGRIENVIDAAKAKGHRNGENPSRWRGHLDQLLPKRPRSSKRHHSALPYTEMRKFMEILLAQKGMAAWALRFLILTAARTNEVLGAKWAEFDDGLTVWTVPAERMKTAKLHRVPLSEAAKSLLETLPRDPDSEFVFPGGQRTKPLSNMSMLVLLRRMGRADLTVHGFRSSFRDWAAEVSNYPHEVAEMALAHAISSGVERAYRRGDLFEKRRKMMEEWAAHCAKAQSAEIIKLPRKA